MCMHMDELQKHERFFVKGIGSLKRTHACDPNILSIIFTKMYTFANLMLIISPYYFYSFDRARVVCIDFFGPFALYETCH